MIKPEWGQKRTCQACTARFYDLKKNPATCPKCGKEFDPAAAVKKRRGRPPLAEKRKAEAAAAAAAAQAKTEAEEVTDIPAEAEIDVTLEVEEGEEELLEAVEDDLEVEEVVPSAPSTEDT